MYLNNFSFLAFSSLTSLDFFLPLLLATANLFVAAAVAVTAVPPARAVATRVLVAIVRTRNID